MWIFPLGAGVVSAVFASLLGRQWLARRRPHQIAWTVALLMFAVATVATAQGVRLGWTPALFRTYYLFGAMVNVPLLAVGTVYLLAPRRAGHLFAGLAVLAAGLGALALLSAHLDVRALDMRGIPEASLVITGRALPRTLSRYYSYTAFGIVVLGALWSARRLSRHSRSLGGRGAEGSGGLAASSEDLRRLASGNVLIAAGTFVVAAASVAVRLGRGPSVAVIFSTGLLAGITTMFAGFLRTRSRPERSAAGRAAPAAISPA
ncbi:MAG TPA: hypothetical protein VKL22_08535 [Actinomycetota bacterium]|nr:hypothetical protein [Actinomycetota bacterium]